ncbi:MAG TPA: hypothetical protein PK821_07180, partial [Victivallales bacterium]|nr:hypothetical protein [Victivallales bacterium]
MLKVQSSMLDVISHSYSYDTMSRLSTVSNGSISANYARLSGTSLLSSTNYTNGSTNVLAANRTYDSFNRLTNVTNETNLTNISYSYAYNNSDQRTKSTLADGSSWTYKYDQYGQITSAKKSTSANQPIPGHSFQFSYDSIGNRVTSHRGTEAQSYASNSLNQYTQRTVPGSVEIT